MNGIDSIRMRERAIVARWVLIAAFAVLIAAFFRTQIVQHEQYQLRAETNRLRPVTVAAPRGQILDRRGRIIAENVPGYTVKLLVQRTDTVRALLERMATVIPLDSAEIESIVKKHRQSTYQPVTVIGDAPFDVVSRLEEHRALFPGMVIQTEPKRVYPAGKAIAHLIGYTGEVTETDLEKNRYPGAELGTIVGKAGLERQYDDRVRGRDGVRYIEVNARGRLVREEGTAPMLPPQPGKPIQTTIDLDLQTFIDSMWPAEYRGAMVAMTTDGQVLALYSAPTYDPNEFTGGIPVALWRELNTDSAKPLLNRATFARYPPASTFKLATAAMALKRGIIDLDTRMPIPCTGGMRAGNRYWRCWKRDGHGDVNLIGAMAGSCNVYFYQVGLRLGINAIVEEGAALGFGDKTGIDLPTELTPLYPKTVAYFDSLYGRRGWTGLGMSMNYSIGQGANTQTLIKMVQFYQAIAGDGKEYVPYLVDRPTEPPHSLGITPKQIEGLRKSLVSVVERGTAAGGTRRALGAGVTLAIAGKTGTAQNPHGKDHGWFIGFAPADDPKIVVGGIMEFAEHGTTVVPYAVRVMRRYLYGPDVPSPDSARVQLLVERDSAPPAPLELDPDSARAAARRRADSLARRAAEAAAAQARVPDTVPARP